MARIKVLELGGVMLLEGIQWLRYEFGVRGTEESLRERDNVKGASGRTNHV